MKQLLTLDWSPQAARALQNLADIPKRFTLMKIGVELLQCQDTLFGCAIKLAVDTGHIEDACKMIVDQAKDDREAVEFTVGYKLLSKIENLYK